MIDGPLKLSLRAASDVEQYSSRSSPVSGSYLTMARVRPDLQ